MKRGKPETRKRRESGGFCIIEVWFHDGEFCYRERRPHREGDGSIDNVAEAVRRLRRGETIWLLQITRLVNQVQRILEERQ